MTNNITSTVCAASLRKKAREVLAEEVEVSAAEEGVVTAMAM